jgi:hypothetical protein
LAWAFNAEERPKEQPKSLKSRGCFLLKNFCVFGCSFRVLCVEADAEAPTIERSGFVCEE